MGSEPLFNILNSFNEIFSIIAFIKFGYVNFFALFDIFELNTSIIADKISPYLPYSLPTPFIK